jgi:pimeloyl-ACP methyl ester carboxylesterase
VSGEGPFDLVFVSPFLTHVELQWTLPGFSEALESLGSFARLIRFDKRGVGMSDRVSGAPTLEARMDDVRAVMDAVGSRRAALFGVSEGAPMSLLFAATYPERTAALVLRSAFPRTMWAADNPWGRTEDEYRQALERDLRLFGTRAEATEAVRSLGRFDEDEERAVADYFRWSGSPGSVEALARMKKEIDVRHVLPAIRVPTLVLHGTEDEVVPMDVARYVAERIPGARLIELSGVGHLAVRGATAVESEVERFLAEMWEGGGWEETEPDRVLATVLFTDIVGSTERAAELGDRAWRELLERHHAVVRRQLVRFRGREVDTAGDGFLHELRRSCTGDPLRGRDRRGHAGDRARRPRRPAYRRMRARRREGRRHRRPHRRARRVPCRLGRGARVEHGQGPRRRLGDRLRRAGRSRAEGDPRRVAPVRGPARHGCYHSAPALTGSFL